MTKAAIMAIQRAQSEPERFEQLVAKIRVFREAFGESTFFELIGDKESPIIHMRMRQTINATDRAQQNTILYNIEEKVGE
jgi:7-keto-8-aminopelargonate synthetase-like enzyme